MGCELPTGSRRAVRRFLCVEEVNGVLQGANGSTYEAAASSPAAGGGGMAGTTAARATIGSEESVVAELCRGSGGVQPRPTPEALRSFVAKASQLDAEVIALELTHKLFNTSWQERVRALDGMNAVAEAVKARGGGHPLQATVDSLCSVTEAFAGVLGHDNPAVRAAAGRVMRAIGVESAVAAAVAAAQPSTGAAGTADIGGDLLGRLDESDASPAATAPTSNAAAPPAPQMEDLLGGLDDFGDIGGGAGAPQPPQGDLAGLDGLDDLGGLGSSAPPVPPASSPPPAAAAAAVDMFAGLTVSPGAASGAAEELDPLEALLGGLGAAPVPAVAGPPAGRDGAAAAPSAAPLPGLDDLDSLLAGPPVSAAPAPPPVPAGAGAGYPAMAPAGVAAGANGMQSMHAMPRGGHAAAGAAPLGAAAVPPGLFGGSPAPGVQFSGQQPAMAYPGAVVGGQPGYGLQAPAGAWNGQAGRIGGQQMHGIPGGPLPGLGGAGGMGMAPQGSVGAPVTQHAFAHATGSLGGHKDAFDFVNDVMKKP